MSSPEAQNAKMLCPRCGMTLAMAERQGVEIDYCPQCRGIWLDSGELDRILERSAHARMRTAEQRPDNPVPASAWSSPDHAWLSPGMQGSERGDWGHHYSGHDYDRKGDGHHGHGHGRGRSWFEKLLD